MISLLIPTIDRSEFLIKQLAYYAEVGFKGWVFIGDSSGDEHLTRTKAAIQNLSGKLNVVHREWPGENDAVCVQRLLDEVSTPYAVYLGDDDFFIPSGLDQCARFLESNPTYSAAHGFGALARVEAEGDGYRVAGTGRYKQQILEGQSASQRLVQHLSDYRGTVFSLHRTESMRAMYRDVDRVGDRGFAGEVLPSCMTVVLGKVKELDCLYLIRQVHEQIYRLPSQFDWVTSANWLTAYQVFRDSLVEEMVRQDGISDEEAGEVVKKAFWAFLVRSLTVQWGRRYAPPEPGRHFSWRSAVRSAPSVRQVWHQIRSFLPGLDHKLSLPALLRPTSTFHNDFMPVYRAITGAAPGTKVETSGQRLMLGANDEKAAEGKPR